MSEDVRVVDADTLWGHILNDLEETLSTPAFAMAIRPLGVHSYNDGVLKLITNKPIWSKTIKEKFANDILRALRKYSQNPEANFSVIVDKTYTSKFISEPEKTEENNVQAVQTQLSFNQVQIDAMKFLSSYNINVKYSFENFVVSAGSKLAFGAAKSVATEPGKVFNPLFIWGGAGLGKTHLVNAIGQYILVKHPELKLKYTTLNDFTNEFTKIMYEYKGNPKLKNEFINKYRNVDVLLIDDVQFLEGRTATQDEIFSIFDYLHRNGKQIVLTSDRQPKDIPTLTDRLRSRFEWGMLAEIKAPDFETRKEILKLKAKENEIELSDEIIDLIAGAYKNNVRELEGALNRIAGYMSIEGSAVTVEIARELLNLDALNKKLTIDDIINMVAQYYHLEPAQLKGSCRSKEIVKPRYVAIYLARELVKASLPYIGEVFGNRKYTSILYAYEETKNKKEFDHELRKEIKGFENKIKAEYFLS
ncbi:MAG: chromosomal replication initiator protein DnaA [bacterium]|nr:chromosomal replication initiator protein DnaA [bacterium]